MKVLLSLCLLFGFIGVSVEAEDNNPQNEVYPGTHESLEDDFSPEENIVSLDFREGKNLENKLSLFMTKNHKMEVMQIGAKGASGNTIHLFPTKDKNGKKITYISNSSVYNADAAILDVDGSWYRIKIAGADGWIESQAGVVPRKLNDVESVSHYSVSTSNNIIHNITKNVDDTLYSQINNGPAPSYLKQGVKYFSFDGHYFYTNYSVMIADSKAKVSTNAVNPNQPYFNYFQFLPMRSESKLSATQIDDYLTKYRGYTSLIPGKTTENLQRHESNLFGIGNEAASLGINLGNNHGSTLGIAINESGWGRSSIAAAKNNVFGHSAYDSYPGAAGTYSSVGESFHAHNTNYLNAGYLVATDFRYEGGYVGNKSSGINVQYASDPYWGEKAANQYRTLDTYYGSQDYGHYQFVFKTSTNITDVSKTPSSRDIIPNMKVKNDNQVFLYLGTVTGENIKGSSQWYKVAVDSLLDDRKNIMSKNESIKDIDFDKLHHIGYVHSSEFKITGKFKNDGMGWTFYPITQKWSYKDNSGWAYGVKSINNYKYYFDRDGYLASGWVNSNSGYQFFEKNGSLKKGWLTDKENKYYLNPITGVMYTHWTIIDGSWYYFNSSGVMLTGWQNINGGKYNLGQDGKMLTGWYQENNNWYYLRNGGDMAVGWSIIGSEWYYFKTNGVMAKGWQVVNNEWYYLDQSGSMLTGWLNESNNSYYLQRDGRMAVGFTHIDSDLYFFSSAGVLLKGWQTINGSKFYFGSNGNITSGWRFEHNNWYYLHDRGEVETGLTKIGSKWYHFKSDGVMSTAWILTNSNWYYADKSGSLSVGWNKVNQTWYHFDTSGTMNIGWLQQDKNWYYLNAGGDMATGWQFINNNWYHLQKSGLMSKGWLETDQAKYYLQTGGQMVTNWLYLNNKWYHFHSNGNMSYGWIYTSGKWYYLFENGQMAVNTTIGGYRVGHDGAML